MENELNLVVPSFGHPFLDSQTYQQRKERFDLLIDMKKMFKDMALPVKGVIGWQKILPSSQVMNTKNNKKAVE